MKPPFSNPPPDPEQGGDGGFPAIGGFRVLRRLATGGTSDIFLARAAGPHGFERVVVLKVLHSRFRSEPTFERMFAREASAYARLSHPAIVKLFDFFASNGQLVMVLEHVDGMPLNKLRAMLGISGDKLDDWASLFVASRVFAALAAAHAAKDPETGEFAPVIHRDVNPSNVLVPWDGHVKLADFGIAKVTGMQGDTKTGYIKGTYGYMAPEQVRGEAVTGRADVYAASLLLWELLTRRKAIQRGALAEVEVLKAMAHPQIPALDSLRPDVDAAVRDAVRRGLEPVADRRAIGADEMHSVLRNAIQGGDEARGRLVESLARVRPSPAADLAVTTARRLPKALRENASGQGSRQQDKARPPAPAGAVPAAPPRPERAPPPAARPVLRPGPLQPPRPATPVAAQEVQGPRTAAAGSIVPAEPSTLRQEELPGTSTERDGETPTPAGGGAPPSPTTQRTPPGGSQREPLSVTTPTKQTVPAPPPDSMTQPFTGVLEAHPGAALGFANSAATPQSNTSPFGEPPRPRGQKLFAPPTLAFGSSMLVPNSGTPDASGAGPEDGSSVRQLPGNAMAHGPGGAPAAPVAAGATDRSASLRVATPPMVYPGPAPPIAAPPSDVAPMADTEPQPHPQPQPATLISPTSVGAFAAPAMPPVAGAGFGPEVGAGSVTGPSPAPLPYQRPSSGKGVLVAVVLLVALVAGAAAGYFGFFHRGSSGFARWHLASSGASSGGTSPMASVGPGVAPPGAASAGPVPLRPAGSAPSAMGMGADAATSASPATNALPSAVPPAVHSAVPSATQAPIPSAVPAVASAVSPGSSSPDSGDLVVEGPAGHRVYVDGKVVGQSPGTFRVRCGERTVHVGSSQAPKTVRVPCSGKVTL